MSTSQTTEVAPAMRARNTAVAFFTFAVFWSALLLFVLEPLFAKLILPLFGGSPSVWLTCMVFFQACLLLGYLYSHVIGRHLTPGRLAIHFAGLFLSCLALPIGIHTRVDATSAAFHPTAFLLLVSTVSIGLPFFFLATSAPLLQRWYSQTTETNAEDPYFLYAASNAGSLAGLALYPLLLEPRFTLTRQTWGWSLGYVLFALVVVTCGVIAYRRRGPELQLRTQESPPPTRKDELIWIALAFVPASLLYAVTSQLSVDFPPVPMLWVVPLAIYLLTFIVGFSSGLAAWKRLGRLLPVAIVIAAVLFAFGTSVLLWGVTGILKLLCFALIALGLHTELARRRPASLYLTRFYLFVSLGGVLAGVLTGLVAPVVFSDYTEYPIALLLGAALLPFIPGIARRPLRPAVVWVVFAFLCFTAIALQVPQLRPPYVSRVLIFMLAALFALRVPSRLTVVAVLILLTFTGHLRNSSRSVIYQARSFYGVYKVTSQRADNADLHYLQHGTTVHGAQRFPENGFEVTPTYYSPLANILADPHFGRGASIGVVGLGTGTTACYAPADSTTTFFEIDPLIEKIARDSRFFTYLSQCPGKRNVVLGDARLTLAHVPPRSFDLLIIDAFSSDTIPMHLLTREAFDFYRRTLAPGGVLMVHVSNRFIDIQPVVVGSATIPGYATMVIFDSHADSKTALYRFSSKWIAIMPQDRVPEFQQRGFQIATGKFIRWSDDFSSLVPVVAWHKLVTFKSNR